MAKYRGLSYGGTSGPESTASTQGQMDAAEWQGQLEGLKELMRQMGPQAKAMGLTNPDGTPNYQNALRFMFSPEFSKFKEANPEIARNAKINTGIALGSKALGAGMDVAKLAFSLSQIKGAKRIDDTPPNFPKAPRRNRMLKRGIAQAYRGASSGLSDAEKSLYNTQTEQDYAKNRQDIINSGGGQSGATQANMALASSRQNNQRQRFAAMNNSVKRQNQGRLDRLTGMQMREDQNIYRHGVNKFNMREMPLWRARSSAKERLLSAGLSNAFNAGDRLLNDTFGIANMLGNRMPGMVYNNDMYEKDDHPLASVYNNPAANMETGNPSHWMDALYKTGMKHANNYYQNQMDLNNDPRYFE